MDNVEKPHTDLHGGICVALAQPDTESAISAVKTIEQDVDVVEIRLDAMKEAVIEGLCQGIKAPLLFTNRPTWEGGMFAGTEEERLAPLIEAVQKKAAFIDLELRTAIQFREQLLAEIHGSQTRLIISCHDFETTPDEAELSAILHEQISSGAHIGKIVTMAHSYLDVLRVLNLQSEAQRLNFPLIAFCMGEEGKLSRIVTLLLGGFMTYAAFDEQQATAPGQLSIRKLREAMANLSG